MDVDVRAHGVVLGHPFYDIRHVINDIRHAYIGFHPIECSHGEAAMSMPCEVAVKSLVPAIRALMAKELTQTHKLKQDEAARLLGITQAAVSKYTRQVRGKALNIEKIREARSMTTDTTKLLAEGQISQPELIIRFCSICRVVRQTGAMCQLCKRSYPSLALEQCRVCMSKSPGCIPAEK